MSLNLTKGRMLEGMLDSSGETLSLWSTMDEWITWEHDKPVMYRFKWIDKDHFVLEIHDHGLVHTDANVIQVNYEKVDLKKGRPIKGRPLIQFIERLTERSV